MMVASLSSFSFRFCLCSVWFCFGSTGSCVTESDKNALRMLSPMISQIDIAVVKLSHDVVSGSISVACTYVDLILDIFGFFFSRHSAFVSRRFIFNGTYWILSFSLSFCHSFSHTPNCLSQHNFLPFACLPNNFGSIVSQILRAVHFQTKTLIHPPLSSVYLLCA